MKYLVIAIVVMLSGCSSQQHRYVVETRGAASPVVSAEVLVCRQPTWALKHSGTRFTGAKSANCEGSGYIRLHHQDGTTTDCQVGYVTLVDQTLAFDLAGRSCEAEAQTLSREDGRAARRRSIRPCASQPNAPYWEPSAQMFARSASGATARRSR
ncbi:MAG: hypothetical protein EON91_03040 [Brevundimonas sp.]|uniref:hypothetical protein n=1 Tax=Brevundimonas sp. TaxID=1871086 RepID=UPI0012237E25|nr:hypothetical protein [Brevundimonas sp.]RZJ19012.1 MAG: hypothetical protein EON91_03040 [Brevundimonas sp.]